ncbi:MAG: two-component regulator propeller domain-containing protein [bacterium]
MKKIIGSILYCLIFFSLLYPIHSMAQNGAVDAGWMRYDTENGLSNNQIFSIAADSNDRMWVGTYYNPLYSADDLGGVNMLNGNAWEHYFAIDVNMNQSVSSSDFDKYALYPVPIVAIDTNDILWTGGGGFYENPNQIIMPNNIIRYDIKEEQIIRTYSIDEHINKALNDVIYIPMEQQGQIIHMPIAPQITGFALDANNAFWVGSYGVDEATYKPPDPNQAIQGVINFRGGLSRFDGTQWKSFGDPGKVLESLYITCIAFNKDGHLLIGGNEINSEVPEPLVLIYNPTKENIVKVIEGDDFFDYNRILALAADGNDDIWVGTDIGLLRYGYDEKDWVDKYTSSSTHTMMTGDAVTSLFIDKEKNRVWIGTTDASGDAGLSCFHINNKNWSVFLEEEMNEWDKNAQYNFNYFNKITKDKKGNVWAGTDNGLYTRDVNELLYWVNPNNVHGVEYKELSNGGGQYIFNIGFISDSGLSLDSDKGQLWIDLNGDGYFDDENEKKTMGAIGRGRYMYSVTGNGINFPQKGEVKYRFHFTIDNMQIPGVPDIEYKLQKYPGRLYWIDSDKYQNGLKVHSNDGEYVDKFEFKVAFKSNYGVSLDPAGYQLWIDLNGDNDFNDRAEKIYMDREEPDSTDYKAEQVFIYSIDSDKINFPEDDEVDYMFNFTIDGVQVPGIGGVQYTLNRVGEEAPEEVGWVHYTTEDGLSHNRLLSIAIDSNDRIWAGSWYNSLNVHDPGGINRFNGTSFDHYLTKDNKNSAHYISSMVIDNKDILWAASSYTDNGLIKYTIGKDQEASFYKMGDPRVALASNRITALAMDNNDKFIWIASVVIEEGAQGTSVTKYQAGLCKYDGISWKAIDTDIIDPFGSTFIRAMCFDMHDNLWIALNDNSLAWRGILVFDPYSEKVIAKHNVENEYLDINLISDIAVDAYGNTWIGTMSGLCRYDCSQGNYNIENWAAKYNSTNTNMVGDRVTSLYIDAQKNEIWIGTQVFVDSQPVGDVDVGLSCFYMSTWTHFTEKDIDNESSINEIIDIQKDSQGRLWIATDSGLYRSNAIRSAIGPEKIRIPGDGIFDRPDDNNGCFIKIVN